ncbi:Aste57867_10398 [Aphanomyces stellatus]|uniref:Aste57867_10398 protein n=1 Tax=Aphanomyces stellatus TaxID=120398 RepID=A0A485KQ90_9STRA|nr:hypothetical protein As57867_010358 [Aphanomyces stellatus]VFT87272.1 Aste57867_10398 [Aphanomyces stellatus]
MLWEKRKRVKPVIYQVEPKAKKPKVAVQHSRKSAPKSSQSKSKRLQSARTNEVKVVSAPTAAKKSKQTNTSSSSKKLSDDERNLLGSSFYEEDGSEWHGTNIHFDELSQLRGMWELPAACHILWLLQQPLKLKVYSTLRDYEAALLNPVKSPVLDDVFTKLLLLKKDRDRLNCGSGFSYSWWSKRLEEHFDNRYNKWAILKERAKYDQTTSDDEDGGDTDLSDEELTALRAITLSLEPLGNQNPLSNCEFKDLNPKLRCLMLLNLCENVLHQASNMEHIREMQDDDLRIQPIGYDRLGNSYYFYPQFYQVAFQYIFGVVTSVCDYGESWQLWAKGLESMEAMRKSLGIVVKKGRKCEGERILIEHVDAMLDLMQQEKLEQQKNEDRELKRAILEAMPRKRSARIQVKTLEKFEEDKQRKERETAEEAIRAENTRLELLASMEKEKEYERKRLAEMREQKLFSNVDRETRRQKRMEQEEAQLLKELSNQENGVNDDAQQNDVSIGDQKMEPSGMCLFHSIMT